MFGKLERHALLCRLRRSAKPPGRAALILPPARPGSLGDQAMFLSTLAALRQADFNRIGVLTYDREDRYTSDEDIHHHQLKDFLRHGLEQGLMRFILHAQGYTDFFLIGADVMDGYYSAKDTLAKIQLARLANRCGLNTRLLGFSFNNHADKSCVIALRTLPAAVRMHSRDPVSHHRLMTLLGRDITLSADLAFLLAPNMARFEVKTLLDRLRALKDTGQVLIGINVAYLILGTHPTESQVSTLLTQVREAIIAVAARHRNIAFIFFAHDNRGQISDVILARRLADSLREDLSEDQIVLPPAPLDCDEIKALCAPLDGAFTCRMHFGIACLSQGVPISAIGYQGKFEGLMERFGLDEMLLPNANGVKSHDLYSMISKLIEEKARLKTSVRKSLPANLKLSASNFSDYLPSEALTEIIQRGVDTRNPVTNNRSINLDLRKLHLDSST